MPVNFDILGAIKPGGPIGSLPVVSPGPSGMDQANSLAGGIMQGLSQGTDIAAKRQAMDQSEQLFPSRLKNNEAIAAQNETKLASDKIDLSNKVEAQKAIEAGRAEAKNGYEAVVAAVSQQDPATGIKMGQDLADLKQKQGAAATAIAKGNQDSLKVLQDIQITGGQLAARAQQMAADPKTGQILAMVGSRDYFDTENDGNFNVTTSQNRQPGSSFISRQQKFLRFENTTISLMPS